MSTYPPSPLPNASADDRVSLFINSPVGSSSYRHSQVASIVDSSASEATPPEMRFIPSSLYSASQGSFESLPYSRASSRTTATDYGLFYTQLGLSPPPSFIERPITPPRILMNPRIPQHRIYQRSPLGIFSSSSPGNSFNLSVTPYSVPVQPLVPSRVDSPPPVSSSSKTVGVISEDSELPTDPIDQPPSYDLVQQQSMSFNLF